MSNFLVKDGDKAEWGIPEGYPWKEEMLTPFLQETTKTFYTPEDYPEDFFVCDTIEVPDFGLKLFAEYVLRIKWDGIVYDLKAISEEHVRAYKIGNEALGNVVTGDSKPDTGEPFLITIICMTENRVAFNIIANTAGEHTFNIYELTIHPMSSEFLPNIVKDIIQIVHLDESTSTVDMTADEITAALSDEKIVFLSTKDTLALDDDGGIVGWYAGWQLNSGHHFFCWKHTYGGMEDGPLTVYIRASGGYTATIEDGWYPFIKNINKATTLTLGVVKQAAAVANVTAAPTAEEFNALLKSLRDAGILATE